MPLRPTAGGGLPEEVVHHVDDFARVDVHKQRVVPVAHPAVRPVGGRQAIAPRIVQPEVGTVIAGMQIRPDRPAAVVPAERIVIEAKAEDGAVALPIVAPVIAAVVAPMGARPALVIAIAVVAAVAALELPCQR